VTFDLSMIPLHHMPLERIVGTDFLAMINSQHLSILTHGRVVDLACGHKLLTKLRKQARCPRCHEMLIRSIKDGSEDYDSFRKGLVRDDMIWEADTMRIFHETEYRARLRLEQDKKEHPERYP
jgi:hypothetical protein